MGEGNRPLEGRVALVTGAGRGIGAAVARRLAGDGARVVVADIDAAGATRVAAAIRGTGGTAESLGMDVAAEADRARALEAAADLGGLEILVNAAGIIAPELPEDVTPAAWHKVFSVNVEGLFFCCQAALPQMRTRTRGRIINFSSTGAKIGTPALISYNASKAAVLAITRGLASRFGAEGITANSVLPGIVDTAMWETINADVGPMIGFAPGAMMPDRVARIPVGRAGVPDDVAAVVAFLASDGAAYVNGQSIHVCGGLLMT
ncbi:MAG TPA: SDR family NAD(P)-dependent oxidoreductase [Bauldia sp.]|nr:SDR family NAD(P)-dependent oxidoreductase [Bauldia sp.]